MDKTRIAKRIRGLLNHAQKRTDEEEQNAYLLAQRLIARYHLEEKDYKSEETDKDIITLSVGSYGRLKPWQSELRIVIADNFRVKTFNSYRVRQPSIKIGMFYGHKDDVNFAKSIYELGEEIIKSRADSYVRDYYKTPRNVEGIPYPVLISKNRQLTANLKHSYTMGFVNGLAQKFAEQQAQNTDESLALMVVVPADVEESYESKIDTDFVTNTFKSRSQSPKIIKSAMRDGVTDGHEVNLQAKELSHEL